jgi:hypothetical protein
LFGNEAQEQARLKLKANLWDGTLARYYDGELRMHSKVRDWMLPRYSYLKYAYLDEAPDKIVVGKQHWMFLTSRIKLSPQSDELLATSVANSIVALDRRLLGNDVEFTIIPIPRKSWVARELLPRGTVGHPAVDDLLIEELIERNVSTVDLRAAYRSADPEQMYYKVDAHWTPHAARIAAREAARLTGLLQRESDRLGQLKLVPPDDSNRQGLGLLLSAGIRMSSADLEVLDLREPRFSKLIFEPETEGWFEHPTPLVPMALAGTSFSEQQHFGQLLSHYCGAEILDGAEAAQSYMSTVDWILRAYADEQAKLERLFWEVPLGTFYNDYSLRGPAFGKLYGRTFQGCPPQRELPLQRVLESWIPVGQGELRTLPTQRAVIIAIPRGVLAHSGDGVVALHISGEVLDTPLLLTLANDGMTTNLDLPPGEFDAVLPIIARGPTAEMLRLVTLPKEQVRLRIDSATLVHQPVGRAVTGLALLRTTQPSRFEPAAPILLGKRAALGIQTKRGGAPRRNLVVEIHCTGSSSPREVAFDQLLAGGWIMLDLGREAGQQLTAILVRAENGSPSIRSVYVTGTE